MKKRSFAARIRYGIDRMMSKGPIAMSLLLFFVTASIVGIIGIIAYFVSDDGGMLLQIWNSLLYTLDAGNLATVSTDNLAYLILMFLATLCGLFLTSVLIGVITTGVEGKLSDLRKGFSVVQEEDHTVIIGFDNHIYALLRELIEANSNHKKACIVVLGDMPKEEMEDAIASHIPNTKTTRIICRSGKPHHNYALERCSVETSRSVIVNIQDDAETVKALLALAAYVKGKELRNPQLRFVASLQKYDYMEVAKIAGEGRAELIFAQDAIARIISNTCRQHGLSQVLTELFNFGGNELYFESVPELAGKTFHEAILSFSNAVPVALCTNGQIRLNPSMDTVIGETDQLVLLEEDDGAYRVRSGKSVDSTHICQKDGVAAMATDSLVVLGSNAKLPIVLTEYAKYVKPGTPVIVVDDDLTMEKLGTYANLEITICKEAITRDLLNRFMAEHANNILLLNDDSLEFEKSDSQTLLRLILLRDVADRTGRRFSITTEMQNVDNKRLAVQARVDDFVIGTDFVCLLMAQVSENPKIVSLFKDLLDETGSELYMKPAADYVTLGQPVNSYTLAESAARKGEIYVGYRHIDQDAAKVVVNPNKEEKITFKAGDQIVVVSEH